MNLLSTLLMTPPSGQGAGGGSMASSLIFLVLIFVPRLRGRKIRRNSGKAFQKDRKLSPLVVFMAGSLKCRKPLVLLKLRVVLSFELRNQLLLPMHRISLPATLLSNCCRLLLLIE